VRHAGHGGSAHHRRRPSRGAVPFALVEDVESSASRRRSRRSASPSPFSTSTCRVGTPQKKQSSRERGSGKGRLSGGQSDRSMSGRRPTPRWARNSRPCDASCRTPRHAGTSRCSTRCWTSRSSPRAGAGSAGWVDADWFLPGIRASHLT
jgi:hypothetical protein